MFTAPWQLFVWLLQNGTNRVKYHTNMFFFWISWQMNTVFPHQRLLLKSEFSRFVTVGWALRFHFLVPGLCTQVRYSCVVSLNFNWIYEHIMRLIFQLPLWNLQKWFRDLLPSIWLPRGCTLKVQNLIYGVYLLQICNP